MHFTQQRNNKTALASLRQSRELRLVQGLALGAITTCAHAGANIGAPTTGPFAKFGEWMQLFVNFIDGPYGLAVVVLSIVLAFSLWMFAPKEGIMGPVVRIAVGAIAIFNVAALVASFQ